MASAGNGGQAGSSANGGIVVIDEASQCTLTNLLPLMFRGKTLAVIGDDNQLPAIPTIQESEELALARKFEIEE